MKKIILLDRDGITNKKKQESMLKNGKNLNLLKEILML